MIAAVSFVLHGIHTVVALKGGEFPAVAGHVVVLRGIHAAVALKREAVNRVGHILGVLHGIHAVVALKHQGFDLRWLARWGDRTADAVVQ